MLAFAPLFAAFTLMGRGAGQTDLIVYPNPPFDSHSAIQLLVGEDAAIRDLPKIRAFRLQPKNNTAELDLLRRLQTGPFRMVREIPRVSPWPTLNAETVSGLALAAEAADKAGHESEADWNDARKYYISMRAYPYDVPDWNAIAKAAEDRDLMPPGRIGRPRATQARLAGTPILSNRWSYVGPTNYVNTQANVAGPPPVTGRVNGAAFDPLDPNTIYACTAGGGVWKTTNGGANWAPLSDDWPCMNTSSVAVDPTNHNRVFVGTGDVPGQLSKGIGIMRTEDGGATWTRLSLEARTSGVGSIVVIPSGKGTVVLASISRGHYGTNGVYRSTDNGQNWTQIPGMYGVSVSMALSAPYNKQGRRYVYAVDMSGRWVYRSADNGLNWDRTQTDRWVSDNAAAIACSPRDYRTLYVMSGQSLPGRSIRGHIFKSTTGADSFTEITDRFPNGDHDGAWGQPDYNYFLACSSLHGQDVVYLGLLSVFVSLDGGGSWQDLGAGYTSLANTHVDQHCAVVNPLNPNQVVVGNDGGMVRFDLDPFSLAFSRNNINGNMRCMQLYQVALDPVRPNYLLGGAQDNGTPLAAGNLSAWTSVVGGDGAYAAINPTNTQIQFGSSQHLAVYRTDTAWSGSAFIGPTLASNDYSAFIAPIELDPNNANTLYGGAGNLHRWDDTTGTWTQVTSEPLNTSSYFYPGITAIAVARGDSNVIYAGTAEGHVFLSDDRGGTWRRIDGYFSAITDISVNPYAPHDVLVSMSSTSPTRVAHCTDTTQERPTWTNVSGSGPTGLPSAPVNAIVRDPYDWNMTWYAGTDVGVFVTENGGNTWANATYPLGLPNVQVNDLKIGRQTDFLTAATFGRGIWRVSVSRPPLNILGIIAFANFTPFGPTPDPEFEFRNPQTHFVFDRQIVKVDETGGFTLANVPYTAFEISVKYRSFLRKSAQVNPFDDKASLKLDLVNGDVDGDNIIGIKDLGIVTALQGAKLNDQGYVANADVNADGSIDSTDMQIVKDNLGLVGDE